MVFKKSWSLLPFVHNASISVFNDLKFHSVDVFCIHMLIFQVLPTNLLGKK